MLVTTAIVAVGLLVCAGIVLTLCARAPRQRTADEPPSRLDLLDGVRANSPHNREPDQPDRPDRPDQPGESGQVA